MSNREEKQLAKRKKYLEKQGIEVQKIERFGDYFIFWIRKKEVEG